MKKLPFILFECIILLFLSRTSLSQNKSYRIIDYPIPEMSALIIIDGLPVDPKDLMNNLNTEIIKSISVKADTLYDFRGRASFSGLVIVSTKDSCNTGLKYILNRTRSWIFSHPLAEFQVNGKTGYRDANKINEIFQIDSSQVIKIKIIGPEQKRTRYKNGALLIKTK